MLTDRLALALISLALASPVYAQPSADQGEAEQAQALPFTLEGSATTDFPLSVGARAIAELKGSGLRLGAGIGYIPEPYLQAINGFIVSVGGYNQETADLIEASLGDSLVWRVDLGWRPSPTSGFYMDLGYRYVTLGGGTTGGTLLNSATGYDLPSFAGAGDTNLYELTTEVHLASLELGWSWAFMDRFNAGLGLGLVSTLDSKTTIDGAFDIPDMGGLGGADPSSPINQLKSFESESSDFIDVNMEKYFHSPLISVKLGYSFF